MHPEWARSLRDQCQAAGVAFHFKQWGDWVGGVYVGACPEKIQAGPAHDWGDGRMSVRVGKAKAGRMLDGREWNEVPRG